MNSPIAISKKEIFLLLAIIGFFCLYIFWGNRLYHINVFTYQHYYNFRLKHVVLLAPGLFVFSLFVLSIFPPRVLDKPFNYVMNLQSRIFLPLIVLLFTALTVAISILVFEGIPHIQDSIAQFFQAKIFASGRIVAVPPELGEFFDVQYIINDGEIWHGKYLFGQSLFLTLGIILKAPFIINPMLGGISLILIYYFAKEMFDEKTSRLPLLLAFTSPFYVFMCSSYMSHVSSLFFITLCLLCLIRSYRIKKWYYPFLAGLSFGFAFNTKPLSLLVITSPFFLYSFITKRKRAIRGKDIFLFCMPVLILVSSFFLYNHILTGDYFTTPYAKDDPRDSLGFGPDKGEFFYFGDGTLPGHSLRKAIDNTKIYFVTLSTDLFGWPSLSLLFIFILFSSLTRKKWDYLLLASIIFIVSGYFFYWGLGICLGARYFFECMPMFLILTVRGIERVSEILSKYASKNRLFKSVDMKEVVGFFVFFLCIINFLSYTPSRISLYHDSYWNVNADIHNQVEEKGIKNALVFVESQTYRKPHFGPDYYNAAFIYNSLDLNGEVVYARNLGMVKNTKLMAQYLSRNYYLFKKTGRAKGTLINLEIKK